MSESSMEQVRAWDRLPEETNKSWEAFQVYISLPIVGDIDERRSLKNTADRLGLASTSSVEIWSSKYEWVARSSAYDTYMGAKSITLREATLAELQNAVINSLSMQLGQLNKLIEEKIVKMVSSMNGAEPPSAADIKRMAEALHIKDDLARRLAHLPTSFISEKAELAEEPDAQVYVIGGG